MNTKEEPEDSKAFESLRRLLEIERCTASISQVNWFSNLGSPLSNQEKQSSNEYLGTLGALGEVDIVQIYNWTDISLANESVDPNSIWWEAEEQKRTALISEALEVIHEDELALALTRNSDQAAKVFTDKLNNLILNLSSGSDEQYDISLGALAQACYQKALAVAASSPSDHLFYKKFILFELGRWPVGIIGGSFLIL